MNTDDSLARIRRLEGERSRASRIIWLMRQVGEDPIVLAMALDIDRVPENDPRRVFEVDAETFDEARKLGIDHVYGLRLVRKATP